LQKHKGGACFKSDELAKYSALLVCKLSPLLVLRFKKAAAHGREFEKFYSCPKDGICAPYKNQCSGRLFVITVAFLRTVLHELNMLNDGTPLIARNDFHDI
jgi:hypothetical protein